MPETIQAQDVMQARYNIYQYFVQYHIVYFIRSDQFVSPQLMVN